MGVEDSERPTEAVAALFVDGPAVAEPSLAAGTQVGGYRIDEPIGKGATGIVYSATHPVIGKRVAIKVLRLDLCDDPTSVERFVMEARSVNAIGHPNIVDIFDLGALPDGRQFLVMDLLIGRTLRRALDAGPLPLGEAAAILGEIGSALAAAHDKGFIHRDLKPDNVFLVDAPDIASAGGGRPDVRILDFGLVKLVAGAHPQGAGVRTRTGVVIGTPAYMSPEQARANNVDHRTDIYALGVMTFELLSGRRPYEHRNVLDLLILHAEAPIPSLRERIPQIPVEIAQLVESMLEKKPDDRPTIAAVRAVLERIPRTVSAVVRAQLAPAMPVNSGPATAVERPIASTNKSTLPIRRSAPRMEVATAAVAMTAMPAYNTAAVAGVVPPPAAPTLPKAVPKGTPSKTEQVPGISGEIAATTSAIVSEELLAAPPASKKLWLLFAIAALLVTGGGLLLGMSL